MKLVATQHLRDFWSLPPDSEQPRTSWADEVKHANWLQPADIKAQFGSASTLKNHRDVFNIKGNDYRIIAAVACRLRAT